MPMKSFVAFRLSKIPKIYEFTTVGKYPTHFFHQIENSLQNR